MKKKKLAFLLGITPDLAFAAGNVALSLRKQMSGADFDIVIYHADELAANDAAAFRSIKQCRLVRFAFPPGFVETMLAKSPPESRFRLAHQLMTFCHFEAFALLAEYQSVVWLDADIAVQGNVSNITRFGPFGITTDDPWKVQVNFVAPIQGYDMQAPGVCCAVMLVQDILPYQAMYKWLYYKAIECARFQLNGDQGIINLALQEFRITPNLMSFLEWQCIAWRPEAMIAKIVHFGTGKKVWNTTSICNAFPEWYRIHREWVHLGGSNFDQTQIRPTNILPLLNSLEVTPPVAAAV